MEILFEKATHKFSGMNFPRITGMRKADLAFASDSSQNNHFILLQKIVLDIFLSACNNGVFCFLQYSGTGCLDVCLILGSI